MLKYLFESMLFPIHFILTFIFQIITMSVVKANNKCNSLYVMIMYPTCIDLQEHFILVNIL